MREILLKSARIQPYTIDDEYGDYFEGAKVQNKVEKGEKICVKKSKTFDNEHQASYDI